MNLRGLVGSGRRKRSERSPEGVQVEASHELLMTGRGSYYTYSFDLGPQLDIFKLADKLLTQDLATIAASPATDRLRVGRRVIEAEKAQRKTESLDEFISEMAVDRPSLRRLFRISKKLSLSIGYAATKVKFQSRFQGNVSDDSPLMNPLEETKKMVKESSELLQKTLMDYHIYGALRTRIEQKEHFPRYFNSEPYIRLEMQQVLISDPIAGDSPIEVSLMLHRSGICILTLSVEAGSELDFADMLSMSGGSRKLNLMRISIPVMSNYGRSRGIKPGKYRGKSKSQSELNWVTIKKEDAEEYGETLAIRSVFEVHLGALTHLSSRDLKSEWHCYTTLSLGAPACTCRGRECKDIHKSDFARLVARAKKETGISTSAEAELLENYLKLQDRELWISAGCAISIAWSEKQTDWTADLHNIIPLESAILQVRQLEQVDSITSAAVVRDKNLFKAQNILAVGLQEYRRNLLPGPDAPTIVETLTKKQGAPELYARLMDRVKVLESLVSTRYSRTQSRRSMAIAISGFLAVLLFLLPRITDSIRTFSEQGDWPLKASMNIDEFFGGRGSVVLWIYLIAIIAFFIAFVVVSFRPRSFRPVPAKKFGYKTDRDIDIVLVDSAAESESLRSEKMPADVQTSDTFA